MKRITLCLLLLILLSSFVQAKEKRGTVKLELGYNTAFIFKDNYAFDLEDQEDNYDLFFNPGATKKGAALNLQLKEIPVKIARLLFMGYDNLDSYEDCSDVDTDEGDKIHSISGPKSTGLLTLLDTPLSKQGPLEEGAVYCLLTNEGKHYAKIRIKHYFIQDKAKPDEEGVDWYYCEQCYVEFDYVYQDDGTPYFGSKASKPSKPEETEPKTISIKPSVSAEAPNVITKRITAGTINIQDGEIVFEISNEDPNHKLEGYLSCNIPSDVIVTSSMGAATGEQAQFLSQKFVISPAPARESMTLRLSSQNEGSKNIICSVNYALFKEDKGYLTPDGVYSSDKKYQQVNVNRDIQFISLEKKAEKDFADYWYFIAGAAGILLLVVILLLIIFKKPHGTIKVVHPQISIAEDKKNKKQIYKSPKGGKYHRQEGDKIPRWILNKFRKSVNLHLPSERTVFYYKGKHNHYIIEVGSLTERKGKSVLPYAFYSRRKGRR